MSNNIKLIKSALILVPLIAVAVGFSTFETTTEDPTPVVEEHQQLVEEVVDVDAEARNYLLLANDADAQGNFELANDRYEYCIKKVQGDKLFQEALKLWTKSVIQASVDSDPVQCAAILHAYLGKLQALQVIYADQLSLLSPEAQVLLYKFKDQIMEQCVSNGEAHLSSAGCIFRTSKGSWYSNDDEVGMAHSFHYANLASMYYIQFDEGLRSRLISRYQILWGELSKTEFKIQRNKDAFMIGPIVERRLDRITGASQ